MKGMDYLYKRARQVAFRRGQWRFLLYEQWGYALADDGVTVTGIRGSRTRTVHMTYDETGYTSEELAVAHQTGYLLAHPDSQKTALYPVYCFSIQTRETVIRVETIDPGRCHAMMASFDSDGTFVVSGTHVDVGKSYSGMSISKDWRSFPTAAAYCAAPDTVETEPRHQ